VVQTQSYGAEARGSAAKSEVIISDQKIAFPMVRKNDVFVALSQTALDRHLKDLKDDGILIFDGDMVKESPAVKAQAFNVPATRTAETQLKSKMQTNMVMLGALAKITRIVTPGSVEKALRETLGAEGAAKSIEAFKTGFDLI
jgi:2-oxoglutarate ferredoxin oxidoreductase subunit gamma